MCSENNLTYNLSVLVHDYLLLVIWWLTLVIYWLMFIYVLHTHWYLHQYIFMCVSYVNLIAKKLKRDKHGTCVKRTKSTSKLKAGLSSLNSSNRIMVFFLNLYTVCDAHTHMETYSPFSLTFLCRVTPGLAGLLNREPLRVMVVWFLQVFIILNSSRVCHL